MISIFRRIVSWISWQRVAADEFQIKQPQKEIVVVLAYVIFYIFAAGIFGYLIMHKPLPILGSVSFTTDVWYALVFKFGLLLIVPSVWFFLQGYRIPDLLPRWHCQYKSIIGLVIAFGVGISLNFGKVYFIAEAARRFSTTDLIVRIGIGVVLPLFTAGIPEEFVYRGILQTRLERVFGRVVAIGLTTILFTAWHLPSRFLLSRGIEGQAGDLGSVLLGTGVAVFVIGLIFSVLWDRYRNLPSLIAVHWGIDIIPAIISFLGVYY